MEKRVLLIADDEEMNRKIISKFLKNSFEVLEADNGKTALEILNSRHVDALLLDIIMPELDGLEVLKEMKVKKELDRVGVLVATSTKEKTERTALSLGADDVVSKPYDPLIIKKRLENILMIKEIDAQKELLQNAEFDSALGNRLHKIETQAAGIITHIQKCADIIDGNKDNFKLVEEIIAEIKSESDKLLTVISGQK